MRNYQPFEGCRFPNETDADVAIAVNTIYMITWPPTAAIGGQNAPNNLDCTWWIKGPSGYIVKIQMWAFHLDHYTLLYGEGERGMEMMSPVLQWKPIFRALYSETSAVWLEVVGDQPLVGGGEEEFDLQLELLPETGKK